MNGDIRMNTEKERVKNCIFISFQEGWHGLAASSTGTTSTSSSSSSCYCSIVVVVVVIVVVTVVVVIVQELQQ